MRAYTSVEQSRKLKEILPIKTADMAYIKYCTTDDDSWRYDGMPPMILGDTPIDEITARALPCWSLAALLEFLPKIIDYNTLYIETSATLWHVGYRNIHTTRQEKLIDACYEMIIKLHEQKLI